MLEINKLYLGDCLNSCVNTRYGTKKRIQTDTGA